MAIQLVCDTSKPSPFCVAEGRVEGDRLLGEPKAETLKLDLRF